MSAINKGPNGIRLRRDNSHNINDTRICENHVNYNFSIPLTGRGERRSHFARGPSASPRVVALCTHTGGSIWATLFISPRRPRCSYVLGGFLEVAQVDMHYPRGIGFRKPSG
jgi:hypothetical protein